MNHEQIQNSRVICHVTKVIRNIWCQEVVTVTFVVRSGRIIWSIIRVRSHRVVKSPQKMEMEWTMQQMMQQLLARMEEMNTKMNAN
jgi:hypothetical protein